MSVIANERLNWLEQVKADAERITKDRLAVEMPKMEAEVQQRVKVQATRVDKPKAAAK